MGSEMLDSGGIVEAICSEIAAARSPEDFDAAGVVERLLKVDRPAPSEVFDGYVDRISMSGIRSFGLRQTLRLSRGLTIVYADNGVGKTSLVDGLELLLHGATTRGRAGAGTPGEVKDEDHVPHVKCDGSPGGHVSRVEIEWAAGRQGSMRSAAWEGEYAVPSSAPPPVHVLARRRLREHLTDKGTSRAARLGAVVGLEPMMDLMRTVQSELECRGEAAAAHGVTATLQPAVDFVMKEGVLDEMESAEELRLWAQTWLDDIGEPAPDLCYPLGDLAAPIAWDKLTHLQQGWREPDMLGDTGTGVDGEFLHMLRSFAKVAEAGHVCPACESGTVIPTRIAAIRTLLHAEEERVERMHRRDDLRQLTSTVARSVATYKYRIAEIPTSDVEGDAGAELRFRELCAGLAATRSSWIEVAGRVAVILRELSERPSKATVDAFDDAVAAWQAIDKKYRIDLVAAESARVRATGEYREASGGAQDAVVRAIATNADSILVAIEKERRSAVEAECLAHAVSAVKVHQWRVVDAMFDELAEPINEWLTLLAPEHTPGIRLKVQRSVGGPSLKVLLDGVKQVHAVGRLSDSQLDMLGFAAHLATIERQQPGATIVIDDPSDMLDRSTKKRLAVEGIGRLLNGNGGAAHQVVVLTHDDELVRELWDAHRDRQPVTLQYYIEAIHDAETNDRYAVMEPRSTAAAVARARSMYTEGTGSGGRNNRLWFRASLATHVRQAIELLCKDIAKVLGPAGLRKVGVFGENVTHGVIAGPVAKVLESVEQSFVECGDPRHTQARRVVAKMLDLVHTSRSELLNPGAHSDVVVPTLVTSADQLGQLEWVVGRFDAPAGLSECSWITESAVAKALQGCQCGTPPRELTQSG